MRYTDPTGKYFKAGNEDPIGCPEGDVYDPSQAYHNGEGCIPIMLQTTPPNWYPLDVGIVVSVSIACGVGAGASASIDHVFDLYDFEVDTFGTVSGGTVLGGSATVSIGIVHGWSTFADRGVHNYSGIAANWGIGAGAIALQGVGTQPVDTNNGQLWGGSVGTGASFGAKWNGTMLEEALSKLPFKLSGGVSSSFNAEQFGLPSMKQVFHSPRKNPTMRDAMQFNQYIDTLASVSQGFDVLAPILQSIIAYNATAWEMQDAWIREHPNGT